MRALEHFGQTAPHIDDACFAWEMACWFRHFYRQLHSEGRPQPSLAEVTAEARLGSDSWRPEIAWCALRTWQREAPLDDIQFADEAIAILTVNPRPWTEEEAAAGGVEFDQDAWDV